jgi:hypothetical protein
MKTRLALLIFGFSVICSHSFAFTLGSSSLIAGWDTETLTFDVNESSCTGLGISAANLNAAIDSAVELWNKAPTASIKLARGAVVSTGAAYSNPPVIVCNSGVITSPDFVAAQGTWSGSGGRPTAGYIQINGDSTKQAYFNHFSSTQAAIVIAHEMGHVLGLGHAEKEYALMYYDISSKSNLSLSQDDVDGITWLNPRNELKSGIMGCATVRDISKNNPGHQGTPGIIVNWMGLWALAFTSTRRKFRKMLVQLKTSVLALLDFNSQS